MLKSGYSREPCFLRSSIFPKHLKHLKKQLNLHLTTIQPGTGRERRILSSGNLLKRSPALTMCSVTTRHVLLHGYGKAVHFCHSVSMNRQSKPLPGRWRLNPVLHMGGMTGQLLSLNSADMKKQFHPMTRFLPSTRDTQMPITTRA